MEHANNDISAQELWEIIRKGEEDLRIGLFNDISTGKICSDPECGFWTLYEGFTDEEINGAIRVLLRLLSAGLPPVMLTGPITHLAQEYHARTAVATVFDDPIILEKEGDESL